MAPHGTEARYKNGPPLAGGEGGCRCEDCRAAAAAGRAERRHRATDKIERERIEQASVEVAKIEAEPGEVCELTDAADVAAWDAYVEVTRTIARLEIEKAKLDVRIKARMGSAETLRVRGRNVLLWRGMTSTVLDQARLRAEHPALFVKYQVEKPHRRMVALGRNAWPFTRKAGGARQAARS